MLRPGIRSRARILTSPRLARAAVAGTLLASYPVLLAAAVVPAGPAGRQVECWLFLAAAAVSYLAEAALPRAAKHLQDTLTWLQVGVILRWVIREAALILLMARMLDPDALPFAVFTVGLVALHAVRALYAAQVIRITQRRRLPVVTRNLDLSALRIPDPPPRWLITGPVRKGLYPDVLPVAGGLVSALTGNLAWGLAAAGLALAGGLGICGYLYRHARRNRHLPDPARVLGTVLSQMREYRPEVVLYFSGAPNSVYQANMWLPTLAALGRPALVIMRERGLVPLLERTSLPVVCLDQMIDLINFSLPSVRVVLYPANTGKNLHLLRVPGVGHVFIGHGDSDKTASFNPFAKVYDEVWVAGKAGRDRYLRAQVGVRDENIVEVGRPQLAGLSHRSQQRSVGQPLTVLYAPTWEGWLNDQCQTSLMAMGPAIVRALLGQGVRVLYKPHPFTGTRDAGAAAAHAAIVKLIEQAGREGAPGRGTAGGAAAGQTAAELSRLGERIREVTGGTGARDQGKGRGVSPDEAALSRDSRPDPAAEAELARLTEAWCAAYWHEPQGPGHRVVAGPMPTLYQCFEQADLLISDISSVVADYLATGKPYVVTNPEDLDQDVFREKFPTAAAGYLLGRDCGGLRDIIAQVARPGDDPLAARRQELKSYLLGPDVPDAVTRFTEAVNRLAARVGPAGEGSG